MQVECLSLVETEEAGLKVELSPHPPMASEGFPKAIGAQTPLKSLGGLGETPEEVKPQHGAGCTFHSTELCYESLCNEHKLYGFKSFYTDTLQDLKEIK